MIYLFTDFGYQGPYIGEVQAILNRKLTHQQVTNLMHDAPKYNPKASAYLLAALSKRFEYGDICMAVVDPGVGDPDRRPVIVEVDGVIYIGPDNGLLSIAARQGENIACSEVTWRPENMSVTFHGRDLFAPLVVKMALRERFKSVSFSANNLVGADWPEYLEEIIFFDHYGNSVTGIAEGMIEHTDTISVRDRKIPFAESFFQVKPLQVFWFINSMGLVEIAVNQGSAAEQLGLSVGDEVKINRK